jgi:hypothetical protein
MVDAPLGFKEIPGTEDWHRNIKLYEKDRLIRGEGGGI